MKVLITSRSFGTASDKAVEILKSAGCELVYAPRDKKMADDEVVRLFAEVDAAIVGNDLVTEDILSKCPKLRIVNKHGVGVDNIDIAAATRYGILVANAPNTNVTAVAEFTIGLMLASARSIVSGDAAMRKGNWRPICGSELSGKTVGIIGFGAIGQAVARLLTGFSTRTVVFDPYALSSAAAKQGVDLVSLEDLLSSSDFVTIHAPLTEETRGLIGKAQLEAMKGTAFLVNNARGGIVDEYALAEALNNKTIAGAAVDVLSQEPPDLSHPLFSCPNLILTPHMAAHTNEAIDQMSQVSAANVVQVLTGKPCPNILNRS